MWGLYRVNIGLTWGLYYWVKAGMGKGRVKKSDFYHFLLGEGGGCKWVPIITFFSLSKNDF